MITYYLSRWSITTLLTLLCSVSSPSPSSAQTSEKSQTPSSVSRPVRRSDRGVERDHRQRAFPLAEIPPGAHQRALEQIQKAKALSPASPNSGGGFAWFNIGPAPIKKSPYCPSGFCSGRVAALAVDPIDPTHHWLIGTAQGGIWETKSAGSHWTPRTDDQASLAMGAIAFAPSSLSTVYAGTGEPNFRGDDYAGAGLLISHDHGATWQMLNTNFAQTSFSSIKVDPNNAGNLVVATVRGGAGVTDAASGTNFIPTAPARGIFTSSDAGVGFTRVLTGEATDLQMNPGNFNQQYAALGEIYGAPTNGVYRTTDGWAHSQRVNGPWTALAASTEMGRIAMAVGSSGTLYVGVAQKRVDYRAGLVGIWRTDNAWATTPTWTQLSDPPVVSDAYSPRFWYHFSFLVDPDNNDILYLTEFDVWRHASNTWIPLSRKSLDITKPVIIHPDNHVMAWVPGAFSQKRLLVGGDGGVLLSDNLVPGTWHDLNNELATLQIYRGAVDPRPDGFLALAGMQDNGTAVDTGDPEWKFITGGDGGDCAISSTNPDTDWAVSYDVQEGYADILRTKTAGLTPPTQAAHDLDFDLLPDYRQFYVHFEKSPRNDDLFIAGTARLWRCDNFFSSSTPDWFANSPTMMDASGDPVPVSAMAFAPSDLNGLIYAFGTEDGQLRITANGGMSWNNLDPADAVPGRYISGLAFSPTDANVLYATLSGFDEGTPSHPGHLFKTANALAATPAWMNVSPPVNLPMNCLAIDPNDATSIFVGSDIGVWSSANGGSSWIHQGPASGMPNVAVFDLRMNSAGQPTAFTHGRSAFVYASLPIITVPLCDLSCFPLWINPEDLVTIFLPLRDELPIPISDLVVQLRSTPQIMPYGGSQVQSYGTLSAEMGAVTRPFQFQAAGGAPAAAGPAAPSGCGGIVNVTFDLRSAGQPLRSITIPFPLGRLTQPLQQGFESALVPGLPQGWSSRAGGGQPAWTTSSNEPPNVIPSGGEDGLGDQPLNISAFVPDLPSASDSSLYSPTVPIVTAQAHLSFRHSFDLERNFDGGVLEIAIGTQPFADILSAGGSFPVIGYNATIVAGTANALGGRSAWSGDSGGWLVTLVNLPASAAGQNVQFRWRLGSDSSTGRNGWFIDDVAISEYPCAPPVTNPILLRPGFSERAFGFFIDTVPSRTYYVEYKNSLSEATWQLFQTLQGTGTREFIVDSTQGSAQRFYRFRVE